MIGVISFPGSNGDHDALAAMTQAVGLEARLVDCREQDLSRLDAVILPGGFSYGDHLRCGAIARFAPVMRPLAEFAARGGPVLGICNGFQILCEAGLLPGALRQNRTLRFHCFWTHVRIERVDTVWTGLLSLGDVAELPIAHGEGAYVADKATLAMMHRNRQVVARYGDASGHISQEHNPNGSLESIASVCNERGNVVGLMPHPERACDPLLGGTDGLKFLRSALLFTSGEQR